MDHPSRDGRSSAHKPKPFQPAVGRDFGAVEEVEARTRDFLARFIALASGAAIGSSGVYGLAMRDFRALTAVWAVTGPVIGAIVTYYFGPRKDHVG